MLSPMIVSFQNSWKNIFGHSAFCQSRQSRWLELYSHHKPTRIEGFQTQKIEWKWENASSGECLKWRCLAATLLVSPWPMWILAHLTLGEIGKIFLFCWSTLHSKIKMIATNFTSKKVRKMPSDAKTWRTDWVDWWLRFFQLCCPRRLSHKS